ncbi:MAG: GAF domain-containing protein [Gemmatimonadaceae bacterium]
MQKTSTFDAASHAVVRRLAAIAARSDKRADRAKEAAECICVARNFHWVGLYDVTSSEIRAIAWTGPTPPAFPTFARTQGLNGAAVATGRPIIVNDVRTDPRYLTTFGTTLAEAVVPVRSGTRVAGTIDVESERLNAFSTDDQKFLEQCAVALQPLWSSDAA